MAHTDTPTNPADFQHTMSDALGDLQRLKWEMVDGTAVCVEAGPPTDPCESNGIRCNAYCHPQHIDCIECPVYSEMCEYSTYLWNS